MSGRVHLWPAGTNPRWLGVRFSFQDPDWFERREEEVRRTAFGEPEAHPGSTLRILRRPTLPGPLGDDPPPDAA